MSERGTGRTTRALLAAPKDAIYLVSHYTHVLHTRELARHLNRGDIKITTVESLERLRGTTRHVLFDHYCVEHAHHGSARERRDLDRALEIAKYLNGRFE